jgi:hypothetical protein
MVVPSPVPSPHGGFVVVEAHASAGRVPAPTWRMALALLALGAGACGRDLTVHLRAGDRPPNPDEKLSPAAAGAVAQPLLAAGVAVDRFQIVLRDLRLQPTPTADGARSENDAQISPAIVLVDLSGPQLEPGAMTEIVSSRSVRWASFYQAVLELRPVAEGDVAADAALAPLLGRTLVVTGRLPGGAPFTYESSVAAVLVRPATYRMGLNHNNATINVELNRWFRGPGGEPLDPRDPAVHPTIEANILESIDGYLDDDRDGNPDSLG